MTITIAKRPLFLFLVTSLSAAYAALQAYFYGVMIWWEVFGDVQRFPLIMIGGSFITSIFVVTASVLAYSGVRIGAHLLELAALWILVSSIWKCGSFFLVYELKTIPFALLGWIVVSLVMLATLRSKDAREYYEIGND